MTRKSYYRQWYLNNQEHKRQKSLQWIEDKKEELGPEKFKEWKKEQNDKFKNKKTVNERLEGK